MDNFGEKIVPLLRIRKVFIFADLSSTVEKENKLKVISMDEEGKIDNLTVRLWLETIEDIVGTNGLKTVLDYAGLQRYIGNFPPDNDHLEISLEDLRTLHSCLIELFGNRDSLALRRRIGREVIRRAIEKRPEVARALKLSAKPLPETRRIRFILERFLEEGRNRAGHTDESHSQLVEEPDWFLIIQRDCIECEGMMSDTPVCGHMVGELQYFVEWITGHPHEVEEIECRAMGHPADVFRIWKTRMEE